jgi:hypothetical protein
MRVPKDVAKARKVALALKGVKTDSFEDKRRWLIQAVRDGLVAKGYKVQANEYGDYVEAISAIDDDLYMNFDVIQTDRGTVYAKLRTRWIGRAESFREPKGGFWPDEFVDKIAAWADGEHMRIAQEEAENKKRERRQRRYAQTATELRQFAVDRQVPVVPADEGLAATTSIFELDSDADGITVFRRFTDRRQAKRFMAAVAEWWEDESKREGA